MAQHYPLTFHRLMHKRDGERSDWEYPFSAAGVLLARHESTA
jgi:ELMO domain-containing protein